MNFRPGNAGLLRLWEHRADLDQCLLSGPCHLRAAKGPHHPRASGQCDDLIAREHQRWQFKALPRQIAHPCLAIDRYTGGLEVGYVAIDGALGDFQPFAQHTCRHKTATAKVLDDLKQAVGAAHGKGSSRRMRGHYDMVLLTPSCQEDVRSDSISRS